MDKKSKSKTEIVRDLDIKTSTLSMIIIQKDTIVEAHESGDFLSKRKWMRSGRYTDVEECLFKWSIKSRSQDIPLSG